MTSALGRENINSEQRQGARLSGLWNVSDSVEVLARVYSEKIESGAISATPTRSANRKLAWKPKVTTRWHCCHRSPRDEELQLATLRIRWQPSWGEFYSATSWFEKDTTLNADWSPEFNLNFGFYHEAPFYTEVGQEDLSQEFRFSSDGSGNFNWLAGFYYLDQKARRFDIGSVPGINEDCPGCFPFIGPDELLLLFNEQSSRRIPLYLARSAGVSGTVSRRRLAGAGTRSSVNWHPTDFLPWYPWMSGSAEKARISCRNFPCHGTFPIRSWSMVWYRKVSVRGSSIRRPLETFVARAPFSIPTACETMKSVPEAGWPMNGWL